MKKYKIIRLKNPAGLNYYIVKVNSFFDWWRKPSFGSDLIVTYLGAVGPYRKYKHFSTVKDARNAIQAEICRINSSKHEEVVEIISE